MTHDRNYTARRQNRCKAHFGAGSDIRSTVAAQCIRRALHMYIRLVTSCRTQGEYQEMNSRSRQIGWQWPVSRYNPRVYTKGVRKSTLHVNQKTGCCLVRTEMRNWVSPANENIDVCTLYALDSTGEEAWDFNHPACKSNPSGAIVYSNPELCFSLQSRKLWDVINVRTSFCEVSNILARLIITEKFYIVFCT
jgi:hypothetical protein